MLALLALAWALAGCAGTAAPAPTLPATIPPVTQSARPLPAPAQVEVASPTVSATATEPIASATPDLAPPVVTLRADPPEAPWLGETSVQVTATGKADMVKLEVWLDDQLLADAAGGSLAFDLRPGDIDGVQPGGAYTLTARAMDAQGNAGQAVTAIRFGFPPATATASAAPTASATPLPTAIKPAATKSPPAPAATAPAPTVGPVTSYRVTEIALQTYPYAPFLRQATDPDLGGYPVTIFDRPAYEASGPRPASIKHRLLILENRYLRLGILPDLGGRIYECTFKPTGNNEFYSNPVVKPTGWGPPSPSYPGGAAWWLGTGGLEWSFPVEEHGYEFGTRWGFDHVALPNGGVMVTLFTRHGAQMPSAVVDIILPPDTAYFVVQPRIDNVWGSAFKFKWWANAMLAPGAANKPGPDLRFIFPTNEVTVHSTGDLSLPGAGQPMAWPVVDGRDLSRLGNWGEYLGAFQRPAARGSFMGVYDTAADEGMLRIYPADVARGAKLFAAGWSNPLDAGLWTDDGSGYVELHGGLMPTFNESYELGPGDDVTWSEIWYPVAGIGGVTFANESGALALQPADGRLRVGLFLTTAARGKLTIVLPGAAPSTEAVDLSPAHPYVRQLTLPAAAPAQGLVSITLKDASGQVRFAFSGAVQLR